MIHEEGWVVLMRRHNICAARGVWDASPPTPSLLMLTVTEVPDTSSNAFCTHPF